MGMHLLLLQDYPTGLGNQQYQHLQLEMVDHFKRNLPNLLQVDNPTNLGNQAGSVL